MRRQILKGRRSGALDRSPELPEKVMELSVLLDNFLERTRSIIPQPNPDYIYHARDAEKNTI